MGENPGERTLFWESREADPMIKAGDDSLFDAACFPMLPSYTAHSSRVNHKAGPTRRRTFTQTHQSKTRNTHTHTALGLTYEYEPGPTLAPVAGLASFFVLTPKENIGDVGRLETRVIPLRWSYEPGPGNALASEAVILFTLMYPVSTGDM